MLQRLAWPWGLKIFTLWPLKKKFASLAWSQGVRMLICSRSGRPGSRPRGVGRCAVPLWREEVTTEGRESHCPVKHQQKAQSLNMACVTSYGERRGDHAAQVANLGTSGLAAAAGKPHTMRNEMNMPLDQLGAEHYYNPSVLQRCRGTRCCCHWCCIVRPKTRWQQCMQQVLAQGLMVGGIPQTDDSMLGILVYPVSFRRNRMKYIKQTSAILQPHCGGDITASVAELVALLGIRHKMANLAMTVYWGTVLGITVDTYVHRMDIWLRWTKKVTKPLEETYADLSVSPLMLLSLPQSGPVHTRTRALKAVSILHLCWGAATCS